MLTVLTHSFPTRLSSDLLERYFLDLPLNGSRSRHSLRAHGYDVLVWVRFLASARGKSVWQADADDVGAYHRARRRSDAEFRISASTRSEEHTSELQSLMRISYAVFCLKKQKNNKS